MNISDILGRDDIYLDVPLERKKDVIRFLAERAGERAGIGTEACRSALAAREKLGSTAVGNGVAFPHAQVEGIDSAMAIFVRPLQPVHFGAADEEPVDLVLMLLTPPGSTRTYLEALARFARALRAPETAQQLRSAGSPEDVLPALAA